MSRNGVGSSAPSLTIRIVPPFSTMKSRSVSPGGAVRYSGKLSPDATSTRPTSTVPSGGRGAIGRVGAGPGAPGAEQNQGEPGESAHRLIQVPHAIGWLVAVTGCTPLGVWLYEDPRVTVARVRVDADTTNAAPGPRRPRPEQPERLHGLDDARRAQAGAGRPAHRAPGPGQQLHRHAQGDVDHRAAPHPGPDRDPGAARRPSTPGSTGSASKAGPRSRRRSGSGRSASSRAGSWRSGSHLCRHPLQPVQMGHRNRNRAELLLHLPPEDERSLVEEHVAPLR